MPANRASHAWGFDSQDSDYDIRFIYIHSRTRAGTRLQWINDKEGVQFFRLIHNKERTPFTSSYEGKSI